MSSIKEILALSVVGIFIAMACNKDNNNNENIVTVRSAEEGKQIFRFDTFGDETLWTDTLKINEVISEKVDPKSALALGLKVDSEALPQEIKDGIKNGSVDLSKPETTIVLLKHNAVVGLKGTIEKVDDKDTLKRVGVTCALCHSTVDNSFAPGIGKRLEGWPNRDLDSGAIIALSPAITPEQKKVYSSWGKGKYDPRYNQDDINGPVVIPPAFGLKDVNRATFTGDGDISYWNRYVGVTQMGGHGTFSDDRVAVNVTHGSDDQISTKLPALLAYQQSLQAPSAPAGSFDGTAANRGRILFENKCASCHSGGSFTDANERLHLPSDVASEPELSGVPSYASRSATKHYRTSPLKGVWSHPPYFHNGVAKNLNEVVWRYNAKKSLGFSNAEVTDLVEYLKSL